jgi:hypothetical protein
VPTAAFHGSSAGRTWPRFAFTIFATLALLNGEKPKVVQGTLAHASITLTMDTYSHPLPEMQEDAAARMEALLGHPTGT